MSNDARGVLLVVSSPSGAGKTTLCRRLRAEFPNLTFSVSYTTRRPRPGEVDGRDYHFVDHETFQEMIARDEFAEYASVHGNLYGTSVATIERALAAGRDVLFDVDYQGGEMLRKRFGEEVVLVFILPPSIAELERRLRARATDDEATIERRLRVAREELRHYHGYDFLVMNDVLDRAYDALRAIYVAQLHVRARMEAVARAVLEGVGPKAP